MFAVETRHRAPARLRHLISLRLREVLIALLPPDVACAVEEITADDRVAPEEAPIIECAVTSRRREFAAGRRCARAALAALGGPAAPIGRGRMGEPLWPQGFAGSITHSRRFAAAVAYPARGGRPHHGIDLVEEGDEVALVEVARSILSDREQQSLGAGVHDGMAIARYFSAKEATMKLVSPALGRRVDFPELETVRREDELIVSAPGLLDVVTRGQWVGGVLITVACMADSSRSTPKN